MKKKMIVLTIAVLGLAATGYVEFLKGSTQPYEFRFDKVSLGDLTVNVTATGTISAVISVDVGTQVSGIITNLYADFNSEVKAGQVIARLDTTFLYQSLRDAEASLEKAQAQLNDSKRNLAREKALVERSLDAQVNLDAAVTLNESNEAAVKSAQAALDRAKINLDYATICAPISGVVVNRAVNVGQTVAASFSSPTLFTIANDLRKMQVQATVDESDVGRVSVGQEATFTVDAYPEDQFKGTVSQIRLAPQSIQNVVNYVVVIDVFNDQLKLMPGMTANVKIKAANAIGAMRVPNMALRFQPPSDLVDTTGFGALRPGFSGRGEGRGDGVQMAQSSLTPGEFGNLPGKSSTMTRQGQLASGPRSKSAVIGDAAKFGIDSKFPEYQKSAYIPSHQSGRGRVWILKSNGKLEPVFVRTGLNDGRYTEVTSRRLKAGDQIVIGATSLKGASATVAQSPLSGQSQQRPMGGMGR
jgi:HlyD family secretion protein